MTRSTIYPESNKEAVSKALYSKGRLVSAFEDYEYSVPGVTRKKFNVVKAPRRTVLKIPVDQRATVENWLLEILEVLRDKNFCYKKSLNRRDAKNIVLFAREFGLKLTYSIVDDAPYFRFPLKQNA